MTKKDYEKIANVFYKTLGTIDRSWFEEATDHVERVACNMADMLAQDNPRFDRDRFLKACGVE